MIHKQCFPYSWPAYVLKEIRDSLKWSTCVQVFHRYLKSVAVSLHLQVGTGVRFKNSANADDSCPNRASMK